MTDNDQDKGTNEAYSLGRLSASIGYINRSIDQINDNVQDLNTKIDKLSTTFAKEMERMKVDVTRHTVELDTKVKFLIMLYLQNLLLMEQCIDLVDLFLIYMILKEMISW